MTLTQAAQIIKQGGVIAYPTETFYGLACDPRNKNAIKKIYQIKGRKNTQAISLILSDKSQLKKWAQSVNSQQKKLMQAFWPGPLTLIFKAKKAILKDLIGPTQKIALRIPSSITARHLAKLSGGAITATSANISGKPAGSNSWQISQMLGDKIDGIISRDRLKPSKGSTILDCSLGNIKVIRKGEISLKRIKAVLNLKCQSLNFKSNSNVK